MIFTKFLSSAIKKHISRCNALEQLESPSTNVFMNGRVVRKLRTCGGKQREAKILEDGFQGFSSQEAANVSFRLDQYWLLLFYHRHFKIGVNPI